MTIERTTCASPPVGHVHAKKTSQGAFQTLFYTGEGSGDVMLIAANLTDYGSPDEAGDVLRRDQRPPVRLRILGSGVLGNTITSGNEWSIVKDIDRCRA